MSEDPYNLVLWNKLLTHGYSASDITGLRGVYRVARKNAGRRSIAFSLTPAELVRLAIKANRRCMVTGISFDFSGSDYMRRPWMPSLDRVLSDKGYTKRNCRLVCTAVNFAMNEWGVDVLNKIGERFAKFGPFPVQNSDNDYYTIREWLKLQGIDDEIRSLMYSRARKLCEQYGEECHQKGQSIAFPRYVLEEAYQLARQATQPATKRVEYFPSDGLLMIGG